MTACFDCPDYNENSTRTRCCLRSNREDEAELEARAEEVMRAKRAALANDGQNNRKARRKAEALERKRRG